MRALVTGGAGFIGSHLVDALLARGDEVVVVDDLSTGRREHVDPAATLLEHDIREPFETDAELVFHLAAQADVGTSMEQPAYDAEVNVVGTVNVLEAARAAGAHLVFSSTGGAIYGEVDGPAREGSALLPVSAYGLAKRSAEVYVDGWNRVFGTRHVTLRFANVYGPRQSASLEGGVVAIFLERLAAGEPTTIFGDGSITRDFVHVDDVVRALLAASAQGGGVFNVGTGVETTIAGLHRLCEQAVGVDAPPSFGPPRPGDAQRSVLDTELGDARARLHCLGTARRGHRLDVCGGGEGVAARRANLVRVVDHPIRLDRVELAVRPWRTATLVVAAIAAVELVLLVMIGGALLAKPEPAARRAAPEAAAPTKAAKAKPAPSRAAKAAPAELPRRKVKVVVLNGNGRQGAAASAASRVTRKGYRIGLVGNAPSHDYVTSLVMYRRGFEGEAQRLARDLGVKVVSPLDGVRPKQLQGAHTVLILGG